LGIPGSGSAYGSSTHAVREFSVPADFTVDEHDSVVGVAFAHERDAPPPPVASVARARAELDWHPAGVADRLGAWLRALPARPLRPAEGHP
jgi:long-chain acyl-CoA synthetase